ncbi:MAG: hypothetical protein JRH20_00105 [Deltaproteobacteria bacterium]|nr:hypothetical protein [Deltaproteobacteria bacterium]
MTSQQRDSVDFEIGNLLRAARPLRPGRPLPAPCVDEPTDEELLLYIDGELSSEDSQHFEAQLAEHPFSSDRVGILREALTECGFQAHPAESQLVAGLLAEGQPAEDQLKGQPVAGQAQNQVAHLVFAITSGAHRLLTFLRGGDEPSLLPQVALATRGAAAEQQESYLYELKKRFDDCDVLVQVDGLGDTIELRLSLEVAGCPLDDGRATLKRRGKLERSVRIRDGVADFSDLSPDAYIIELRRNGSLLGQIDLKFLRA